MSQFGDRTLKQDLLEAIENVIDEHNLPLHLAAGEVAIVLAHLCDTAFSRDAALRTIKAEAVEQAKVDLTQQLRGLTVAAPVKPELPRRGVPAAAPKRRRNS